jgi:hypothetical protein
MLNQILEAVVTALVGLLLVLIPIVFAKLTVWASAKINAIQVKTGAEDYNHSLAVAKSVYGIVDEYFRITPTITATIEAKVDMFETEILKICPYLTADDIDHLRQAVAGELNILKDKVTAPAPII